MSLSNKNQRFLASTRGQIITLLRRASRTVDELAQALDLTDNAVRAHLAALERDGIVQQRGVRRGGGKPSTVYELAPEADQLFPKAYDPVLQQLLEVLSESMPSGELEMLLREVGRRMADGWKVPSGELRMRLAAAVEVYNKLGGMAEVEACDGHSCIRSYSCPFAAVVLGHPVVCRLAETLLTELVGVPVQQHCENEGSQRCFFTVLNT
jgi:predicted ArsR family transcriptional regulator